MIASYLDLKTSAILRSHPQSIKVKSWVGKRCFVKKNGSNTAVDENTTSVKYIVLSTG